MSERQILLKLRFSTTVIMKWRNPFQATQVYLLCFPYLAFLFSLYIYVCMWVICISECMISSFNAPLNLTPLYKVTLPLCHIYGIGIQRCILDTQGGHSLPRTALARIAMPHLMVVRPLVCLSLFVVYNTDNKSGGSKFA